jgi:hypothetical protein
MFYRDEEYHYVAWEKLNSGRISVHTSVELTDCVQNVRIRYPDSAFGYVKTVQCVIVQHEVHSLAKQTDQDLKICLFENVTPCRLINICGRFEVS